MKSRFLRLPVLAIATLALVGGASAVVAEPAGPVSVDGRQDVRPLVIGHRGAAGYRPEHTLASYELAARMGADHLEPDLVATADGVLVARHEPELGASTDIATRPEFADRRTSRVVDGAPCTGWFVDDLTLAELRTLRVVERLPALRPANTRFDGHYPVPTFAEILGLRARLTAELGRAIGVYPETKSPGYFADRGLPLEPALVDALRGAGLDHPGPLVDDAHAAGLAVHAFTFRDENAFLPTDLRRGPGSAARGDGLAECVAFFEAGVDGVFADHPDTAVAARDLFSDQTMRLSS
jgi:glycerophosphoryl diester phosphodiesterase